MTFTVSLALPNDIPHLSTIQWAALSNNPLIQTLYPQGATPALTAFTKESYEKAVQFPSVRLIKATEEERGEIVAFAKWVVYSGKHNNLIGTDGDDNENKEEEQASGWANKESPPRPEGVDEKALLAWNTAITKSRTRVMRKRKCARHSAGGCSLECYFASIAPALWVLDIIHTHPSHQGRGAATQLLKWGTDLADEMRMHCYVESSPAGYPLFKNHGFEDVTDIEIDLGKYRDGYGSYRYNHVIMTRPPDTPPMVPPKDPKVQQVPTLDFGFPDEPLLRNGNSGRRISGKASLIEIKRSPRPDRSRSSKGSNGAVSPLPADPSYSFKESDSVISPMLEPRRSHSSRQSDSMTSLTGQFPEPPFRPENQERNASPTDPVWFYEPPSKPDGQHKKPTVDRVWFSEHI